MRFKCPVGYDINNCSSKDYGLTCDTCFHTHEDDKPDLADSLIQSLKEMQLMREGKLPKKTWEEYKAELDRSNSLEQERYGEDIEED